MVGINQSALVINNFVTPSLYERTKSIQMCFFVGASLSLFSLICAIIVFRYEGKASKLNKVQQKSKNRKLINKLRRFNSKYFNLKMNIF